MSPIGVFDSGYGGLTVLRPVRDLLPEYDFIYLGDNARAPYGTRSFETVYQYTKQCVNWLFDQGCPLVIVACNTASAKALRNIQQKDLVQWGAQKRVLGVIRPTAEIIGQYTSTNQIGILATKGTVLSESYLLEIHKCFPEIKVYQQACPLWVSLIENNAFESDAAKYFLKKDVEALLRQSDRIDTLLLGCTHYPLINDKLLKLVPGHIKLISQGPVVAEALKNYLERHPEIEETISRTGKIKFYTTDSSQEFESQALNFFGENVKATQVYLT